MSQIFAYQSHQVRTITENSETWFVAKDVCHALGLVWKTGTGNSGSLAAIPESWKGVSKLHTPSGKQALIIISEPAVYKLAFRSNKPEADAFTNWVASEVLPAIRQGGKYEAAPKPRQAPLPLPPARDPLDLSHYFKAMRSHSRRLMEEYSDMVVALKVAYPMNWNRQFDHHSTDYAALPLLDMVGNFASVLDGTLRAVQNHAEAFARVKRL